jgi:hypothetical protein
MIMLAVNRAHQEALKDKPQGAGNHHGHQHGQRERGQIGRQTGRIGPGAQAGHQGGGDECAQCDEYPMSKIEHIHQAEDQRESGGNDENDHAHGQPGNCQCQPG